MTRKKQYVVKLTEEERQLLEKMVSSGIEGVRKINRARILLKADQGEFGPGWIDKQIGYALDIGIATVERTRKKFVNLGLDEALNRKVHNIKIIRRKLVNSINLEYTPAHASWLNAVELENSIIQRQLLKSKRIGSIDELIKRLEVYQNKHNAAIKKVIWQFTTKDARIKLRKLYPTFVFEKEFYSSI